MGTMRRWAVPTACLLLSLAELPNRAVAYHGPLMRQTINYRRGGDHLRDIPIYGPRYPFQPPPTSSEQPVKQIPPPPRPSLPEAPTPSLASGPYQPQQPLYHHSAANMEQSSSSPPRAQDAGSTAEGVLGQPPYLHFRLLWAEGPVTRATAMASLTPHSM